MKYDKLKSSENKKEPSALQHLADLIKICAGRIGTHTGERVRVTFAGAAVSNEVKQAENSHIQVRDDVCEMTNSIRQR